MQGSSPSTTASTPAATPKTDPVKNQKTSTSPPDATDKKRKGGEIFSDEENDTVETSRKGAKTSGTDSREIAEALDRIKPPYSGSDPDVPLTQRERGQFMIELARWGLVAGFGTSHHERLLSAMINVIEDE